MQWQHHLLNDQELRINTKEQRDSHFEGEEDKKEERGIRTFTRARILIWLLECKRREECRNRGLEIVVQPGKLKCRLTSSPVETKELLPLQKCTVAEQLEG